MDDDGWFGKVSYVFFPFFSWKKIFNIFLLYLIEYNSSQRNRLTAPPPFPRKNKNIVSIRGAQPSNLTFNTHGSLASKKKRRKSKVDKRERGGWNFYNLWWSFFFFFFYFRSEDAAAIKRPPSQTPGISFSSPFSNCNAHHRRFDQPRWLRFSLHSSLYDFPAGLHFTLSSLFFLHPGESLHRRRHLLFYKGFHFLK